MDIMNVPLNTRLALTFKNITSYYSFSKSNDHLVVGILSGNEKEENHLFYNTKNLKEKEKKKKTAPNIPTVKQCFGKNQQLKFQRQIKFLNNRIPIFETKTKRQRNIIDRSFGPVSENKKQKKDKKRNLNDFLESLLETKNKKQKPLKTLHKRKAEDCLELIQNESKKIKLETTILSLREERGTKREINKKDIEELKKKISENKSNQITENIEITSNRSQTDWAASLTTNGFRVTKNVIGDGNCLYRSLTFYFFQNENRWREVKERGMNWIKNNKITMLKNNKSFQYLVETCFQKNFERYLLEVGKENEWGDSIMILALSNEFKINIKVIFNDQKAHYPYIPVEDTNQDLWLYHLNRNHFVVVKPTSENHKFSKKKSDAIIEII